MPKRNKLRGKIAAKIDLAKTVLFNIFAPNLTKHITRRYWEMYDALQDRDEEYETDVNDAWKRIHELETELERLKSKKQN